jgi:hypothetical protein
MTDITTRRAQTAARGRKHRRLRARGGAAYYVRPNEDLLAEALIKSGMDAEETDNRDKVEAALDGLVAEWIMRKLHE